MNKIKNRFRKKEIVEAEQWFPGGNVEGVCNSTDSMLCGCIMFGGPAQPHVHYSSLRGVLIHSGDWVIKDKDGKFKVCDPDEFERIYESID